ncbi:MAG: acyl-CoA dehydrogenase C-terminal domain-containing protein, partial [Pseudomonadota bacterium]
WIMARLAAGQTGAVLTGATPYLRLFGVTSGGVYLAKAALAARADLEGLGQHVDLARFFAANVSVSAPGLARTVMAGAESVLEAPLDRLAS